MRWKPKYFCLRKISSGHLIGKIGLTGHFLEANEKVLLRDPTDQPTSCWILFHVPFVEDVLGGSVVNETHYAVELVARHHC